MSNLDSGIQSFCRGCVLEEEDKDTNICIFGCEERIKTVRSMEAWAQDNGDPAEGYAAPGASNKDLTISDIGLGDY